MFEYRLGHPAAGVHEAVGGREDVPPTQHRPATSHLHEGEDEDEENEEDSATTTHLFSLTVNHLKVCLRI